MKESKSGCGKVGKGICAMPEGVISVCDPEFVKEGKIYRPSQIDKLKGDRAHAANTKSVASAKAIMADIAYHFKAFLPGNFKSPPEERKTAPKNVTRQIR